MSKITINSISIDPDAQKSTIAFNSLMSSDSSDSNYILVQTDVPLNRSQKTQLINLDAIILEYVPENTYICRYDLVDLNVIRNLPFVKWTNVYLQGFKISPRLLVDDSLRMSGARSLIELDSVETTILHHPQTVVATLHLSLIHI